MGLCNISLALLVGLMGLALAHTCCAQNSPQDYVDAHNAARAQVGVGSITWDNTVAAYAQNYANQRIGDCNLVHSSGPYGENLAKATPSLTGTDAVNMWVGEKSNYNYNSNSCVGGQCLHYTQVVWRDSVRLGCARVQCNNGWWFVTCNYDPPGNYVGQRFTDNSDSAQNSPQDYVNAHNAARAEVGVGPMTWDNTVAAYAQNYTNQRIGDCNLVHSGGPYGENLAKATPSLTGTDAVNLWVGEKSNYDYNSNSCVGGQCGHYTQVVWRNSIRLGCARLQCNNGWWFVTCNYDPPGNYVGQRPFTGNDSAQNSAQDYVNAHNAARAEVGVGPMTWDNTVAAYAQNYANQRIGDCNLVHSGGPYGENLAMGSGSLTGTDAVNLWVGEKSNYDYNSNSCVDGECLHYTQVVWRNSTRLGCARVQCNNGWWFVTCNYDPPGNYVGQRPFTGNSDSDHSCLVAIY